MNAVAIVPIGSGRCDGQSRLAHLHRVDRGLRHDASQGSGNETLGHVGAVRVGRDQAANLLVGVELDGGLGNDLGDVGTVAPEECRPAAFDVDESQTIDDALWLLTRATNRSTGLEQRLKTVHCGGERASERERASTSDSIGNFALVTVASILVSLAHSLTLREPETETQGEKATTNTKVVVRSESSWCSRHSRSGGARSE